ncbi:MAG: hypothetical protein U0324_34315 [Polyangiales bacterium]
MPNPNDPPKGGARRVGVIVMVLFAAAAGAILALRRPPHASSGNPPPAPRPGELPRDPFAYVPASARTLVVADLARLRSAPATRGWFAEAGGAPSCQEAIARRVRTVALVIPRLPPDDFAFVAAGDLSPADLARCAPGAEPVTREGFTLTAVRSRRDGGAGGVVAWTPQGVVLVGAAAVVDAMLDRAIDVARGHASQPALDPLRPLVAPEAAVWALHLADGNAPPNDPLAAVSAGALSVTVSDAIRADATLRCDDGAHARRLEEALGRMRSEAVRELTEPHFRAAVEGAAVSVEGADVRVRAALSAEVTAAVGEAVSGLARRAAGALGAP